MKLEDGKSELLESGIIDDSDVTFVYPDKTLRQRLLNTYPNLQAMPTVIIIEANELSEWTRAFTETLNDYEIPVPA